VLDAYVVTEALGALREAPPVPAYVPLWRLTCVHETPLGARFVEVVSVEVDAPESQVVERFFTPEQRAYYTEIRVEPAPRLVGRCPTPGDVREVNWLGEEQAQFGRSMSAELAARLAELPEHFVDPDNREVKRYVPAKASEFYARRDGVEADAVLTDPPAGIPGPSLAEPVSADKEKP
jgi:hypothetical protein